MRLMANSNRGVVFVACVYRETCPFFLSDVGYSPELNHTMRQRFCLDDSTGCARYIALLAIGREQVPMDLLPSDCDRLADLGVPESAIADCEN